MLEVLTFVCYWVGSPPGRSRQPEDYASVIYFIYVFLGMHLQKIIFFP